MRHERVPETNSFGLVLPPSSDNISYLLPNSPKPKKQEFVDRHHLYWPRSVYLSDSKLAFKFREHRFNSVWILRTEHDAYHAIYDSVPIPPREVMQTFLEEAKLLEELNVCVQAIEMIDSAIYQGLVVNHSRVEEKRCWRLERAQATLERAARLEVIPLEVAQLAVERAMTPALAA